MNSVDQAKSMAANFGQPWPKATKIFPTQRLWSSLQTRWDIQIGTQHRPNWKVLFLTRSASVKSALSSAFLMRPKQESSTAGFLASKSHLSIVTKSNCRSTWASSVPVRFYILQSIMATQAPDRTYFCQRKKFECFIRSFRISSIPSGVLIWKNCRGACKSKCMTHLATEFGFANKCPE